MRLVLCNDDRILCEALGAALEARGHQVLATATAAALGIAGAARYQPDACPPSGDRAPWTLFKASSTRRHFTVVIGNALYLFCMTKLMLGDYSPLVAAFPCLSYSWQENWPGQSRRSRGDR